MTTLCSVFQNHSFYDPKKIEGFEMKIDDVKNTINYIEKMSSSNLRNHPCIKNKYKLLLVIYFIAFIIFNALTYIYIYI